MEGPGYSGRPLPAFLKTAARDMSSVSSSVGYRLAVPWELTANG